MSETEPAGNAMTEAAAEAELNEMMADAEVVLRETTELLATCNAKMTRFNGWLDRQHERFAEEERRYEAQTRWVVRPWSLAAFVFGLLGGLLGGLLSAVMASVW